MSQPLGKPKKFLFSLILILITWLLMEGGVSLVFRALKGVPFPREEYQTKMLATSLGETDPPGTPDPDLADSFRLFDEREAVIHPYLGFVPNFTGSEGANYPLLGWPEEMLTRSDDRLVVAIFGGSFAAEMYVQAGEVFVDELEAATGREVALVQLAYGGYKQPQQALALTYLLTLGAEFDVIINVDGYNEVALAAAENVTKGVFPVFPRSWYYLAERINDPETLELLGRLGILKIQKEENAKFFREYGLYRSNLMLALWRANDVRLSSEIAALQLELLTTERASKTGYDVTGPTVDFSDADKLYPYLASVWRQGSLEMQALGDAHGMMYYHFLQPNQYVEGSKPMSEAELAAAYDAEHPYREGAVLGYPLLWEYSEGLLDAGVNYHNLTWIFKDNEAVLYRDTCCHLNEEGYRLVAAEIVRLMIEDGLP